MRYNGRGYTDTLLLTSLVAADGLSGGFIKDSQAGSLPATTTNDDAAAGTLGEFVSATTNNGTATVTITIASPGVISWASHGLVAGSIVTFSTTGALPTGITALTPYYVISSGLTANTFQISATPFGSAINTSGSQSGTHTGLSAVYLTTNTPANAAAISLTAGDWDVQGNIWHAVAGGPTVTYLTAWLNTTSATAPDAPANGAMTQLQAAITGPSGLPTGTRRLSLASTTTVYLGAMSGFTGGTSLRVYGFIGARRAR